MLITKIVFPKFESKIRHPRRNYDTEKEKHLFSFEHPLPIALNFWPRVTIGTNWNSCSLNYV